MDRETLYDLRALLALYPYYQTARLLMLKNLYLLHDPSFDEELRRAAIYISDRKVIFQMIEAAHYQLKRTQNKPQGMGILDAKKKEDRTSSLIDHFLDSIPTDAEENEKKKEKRKPTPADAAVDYVSYLMETEAEQKMRYQRILDVHKETYIAIKNQHGAEAARLLTIHLTNAESDFVGRKY